MKTESFWELFAYLCFIIHTLCLVELIDVIYFKKLYLTLFIIVFAGCYYFTQKIYKIYLNKKIKNIFIGLYFAL